MPTPLPIQKRRENRRLIESGPTQPVDETTSRNQCCRAAVSNNSVIVNFRPAMSDTLRGTPCVSID